MTGRSQLLTFLLLTPALIFGQSGFYRTLADSAFTLTLQHVRYDPSYFPLAYPNGDVPPGKGVCTDVVVRAYRKLGIDLQQRVHEDMKGHFSAYPANWGLSGPDTNIDHRRVPNLMTFFGRHGETLALSRDAADYRAGDIVCWDLGGGTTHIGILANRRSADGTRPLVIHNIGAGQVLEDMLFRFTIIGHYRYRG